MKKKILYSLIVFSVLLIVSFITIYAAFIITNHYEANIEYHEIKDATLTNSVENSKVSFNYPGDQINVTYNLKNSDQREYEYYYSFEWGQANYSTSPYLNMIYVYQNGEYCGMLKDYLVDGILPKKDLPFTEYIFTNETRSTVFTFELHNESTSLPETGLNIEFNINANLSTTNVQEVMFVDSSNFDNAIQNINNGGNQKLILTGDITTTGFEVKKDMVIDLCGNTLSLSSASILLEDVNLKITDSRTGGKVLGEGFSISHATSFVELEAPVSKITKTEYDKSKLISILENKFDTNNVIYANEDYDIFGYYKVYGLTATSTEVTIDDGVVKASTHNTNSVITITVDSKNYEFKYIGNNSTVISDILNNKLKHMTSFADPMNGIQVANDLFLPNAIKEYNATISWYSNNTDILSHDGKVQEEQGNVLLTATIKVFDIVFVQDYYVYIIQPDNMSKLQYLIARVEQGVTVNPDTDGAYTLSSELRTIGEKKYLPVSGETTIPYHYTLWTEGLDLGIIDIEYSKESMYQYIELEQAVSNDIVTEATVKLSQVTYSKYARIEIIATFDNNEEISAFITIAIILEESDLAYEVFDDIQLELDKVDVLKNILNTRKDEGVKYERGDFYLPARVDVVEVEYVSQDSNLYTVIPIYGTDEEGNQIIDKYQVHFVDLKYLDISDKRVSIKCNIVDREQQTVITTQDLFFSVPGAITTNNFESMYVEDGQVNTVKIFNMSDQDIKRLFYSIKLQVLQQAESPFYDKKTVGGIVNLNDVYDVSMIYSLGEYILFEDIDDVTKLIFEYGRNETILNYYDLEILFAIFEWALIEDEVSAVKDTPVLKDHIDSNLTWIKNDGTPEITDAEITIILSYGEKYTGFNDIWKQAINTLDNELTDDEISLILEALAEDKTYISLLKWATDDISSDIPISQWLTLKGISLDENNVKKIPIDLLSLTNGDSINITNDEERVLIYYLLANNPTQYSDFISIWNTYITKQSNSGTLIKQLTSNTVNTNNLNNGEDTRTFNACYDPVFTAILNWAFFVGANKQETSGNTKTLQTALGTIDLSGIFTEELNYSQMWFSNTSYEAEGEYLTANEWRAISRYLYHLGVREVDGITIYGSDNNDDGILSTLLAGDGDDSRETIPSGVPLTEYEIEGTLLWIINKSFYKFTLTTDFVNKMISAVNGIYTSTEGQNYNKLVSWAKSTTVDKASGNLTSVDQASWQYILGDNDISVSDELADDIRIKDCSEFISVDEERVLRYYLTNKVFGSTLMNDNLRTLLVSMFLDLDMSQSMTSISDVYNDILLFSVSDADKIETIINNITNLGTSASDSYYDNLSTISSDEIKEMVMLRPGDDSYVAAIQNAFDAYIISRTQNGNSYTVSVTPVKTGEFDRTLEETEIEFISDELLEKLTDNEDAKYTYLTINQITAEEVDVFRVLTHFSNLNDLSFRGTSAVYLFDSNETANSTFNLVALSSNHLSKLTMNYCGVSDISAVTSLLYLTHLNLRSNYQKGSYNGLENISALISLGDLKESGNKEELIYPHLEHLNVYDTNVTLRRGEIVLGKLYQLNTYAELYMDVYGEEKKYPFVLTSSEEAVYALSLLFELDTLSGTYIILPDEVYRNVISGTTNTMVSYDIKWSIVVANSLIKITNVAGYTRLDRISNETGQVTISAAVTVNDVTEIRYFVIEVI